MSNHGERFLFRVLEPADQQQEVLLLINQGFPKALCPEIVQVQFLHLQGRQTDSGNKPIPHIPCSERVQLFIQNKKIKLDRTFQSSVIHAHL